MLNVEAEHLLHDRWQRYLGFLAQDADNVPLLQQAADLGFQLGHEDQATSFLTRGLRLAPTDLGLLLLKGVMAIHYNHLNEAEVVLGEAQRLHPDAVAVGYNLGYMLLLQGRYQEALSTLQAVVAHLDQLPQAAELYVNALHFCGQVDEAVAFAEATLETHPQLQGLQGLLASLCLDQEDWSQAQRYADLVLKARPEDTDALSVMGSLALADQNVAQAQAYFGRAIASYPSNGRAWAGQAMAAMLAGDLDQCEHDLRQALSTQPTHVGTWHALAWCQIFQQRLDLAQATFEHALALAPAFADSHGGLAVLAMMRGAWAEGAQHMTVALRLDPHSFSGLYAKTLWLQGQGQANQAQALMLRLQQTEVLPDGSTLEAAVAKLVRRSSV